MIAGCHRVKGYTDDWKPTRGFTFYFDLFGFTFDLTLARRI